MCQPGELIEERVRHVSIVLGVLHQFGVGLHHPAINNKPVGLEHRCQGVDDPQLLSLIGSDRFHATLGLFFDQIGLEHLLVDLKASKVGFNQDLVDVMLFGRLRQLLPKAFIDAAQPAAAVHQEVVAAPGLDDAPRELVGAAAGGVQGHHRGNVVNINAALDFAGPVEGGVMSHPNAGEIFCRVILMLFVGDNFRNMLIDCRHHDVCTTQRITLNI